MIQPAKFVVLHPKLIIIATIAITIAYLAIILTRGVEFNGSPETLAPNDDAYRFYNETRTIFGDDKIIIVAITTSEVFTPTFIDRLDRLTNRLAAIPGVHETLSLTNVKAIRREADGVSVGRLIEPRVFYRADEAELEKLKHEITNDPLYARHYVSLDGKTAAINVFLMPLGEAQNRAVAEEVERVAKSEANGDEVFLSGVPIVDARGIRSMVRDMLVLSPVAAVLCFCVFLLAFRTLWGAMLPMSALIIGLIWTIGLMSLLEWPITLATLSLPTTLMAVGSSYMFHVLNQYRVSMSTIGSREDRQTKRNAWLEGLTFISPAVVVSGTATMAGFGALASSTVPTARDMGIFEALGVLALLILTVAFIPAALALLPRHALGEVGQHRGDYATWLNGLLVTTTALILFRKREVFLFTVVATVVLGAGAGWLQVNTNYLHIFPRGSETVRDAEKLHERLAGAATVQLVVSGNPGSASDPVFLRTAMALEQFATTQSGVDAAISVLDIIKRVDSVIAAKSNGAVASSMAEEIPDPARLSSIFRDYLSQDESLSRLVSDDLSRLVIVLRVNLFSSNELR